MAMSTGVGAPNTKRNRRAPLLTVVAAVIERDGRVLVCQRKSTDNHPFRWEFPGGKVKPGESPQAALRRELEEELAIRARIGPEIARYPYRYGARPPIRLIFYRVSDFRGEPKNLVFEQIRWTLPAELLGYDFLEGDLDFVRRLAQGEYL